MLRKIDLKYESQFNEFVYSLPMFFSIGITAENYVKRIQISSSFGYKMTSTEVEYFNKTKKIPESYRKITETDALKTTMSFIKKLLEQKSAEYTIVDFDSVNVLNDQYSYVFYVYCKQKTDVFDIRNAEVKVNANTGIIRWFSGDLFLSYDLNYKPKISKDEAQKIVEDTVHKKGKKISYKSVYIRSDIMHKEKWYGFLI